MDRLVHELNSRLAMMMNGERVQLLKDGQVSQDGIVHRRPNGKALLRSSSLYRLKHFPGYLCRQCTGSSDVFDWLYTSRTRLTCLISAHRKQWRIGAMRVSVYLAVVVVFAQWAGVVGGALSGGGASGSAVGVASLPPGFCFLVCCMALIGALAGRLLHHFANKNVRPD